MGNRAVITIEGYNAEKDLGIYLHWNGGRDSVEAFLTYCGMKGYRSPEGDCYGWARICQVVGNFFGGSDSIGIDRVCCLDCDNFDNGVYLIKDWKIVGREYFKGKEQKEYELLDFLVEIDECQPESERLKITREMLDDYLKQKY